MIIDETEPRYCSYETIPLLLNAEEIVRVLGLSKSNVYELLRSDGFPTIVIGGRKLVRKEKLFAWLEGHETVPSTTSKKPNRHPQHFE